MAGEIDASIYKQVEQPNMLEKMASTMKTLKSLQDLRAYGQGHDMGKLGEGKPFGATNKTLEGK